MAEGRARSPPLPSLVAAEEEGDTVEFSWVEEGGGDLCPETLRPPLPPGTRSRVLAERLLSGRGGGMGTQGDSDKRRTDPGSGRGTGGALPREEEDDMVVGIGGGGTVGSDKKAPALFELWQGGGEGPVRPRGGGSRDEAGLVGGGTFRILQ